MFGLLVIFFTLMKSQVVSASRSLTLRDRVMSARLKKNPLYPDCACVCCVVERVSTLSEITGKQENKCAPPLPQSPNRCVDFCTVPTAQDSILRIDPIETVNLVHYSRFCFYECKPPKCESPAREEVQCESLSLEEAGKASEETGNGKEVSAGCY
eukprot:TRINITY_DN55841_c0_g1_i1.p1 TRINITY_DN55841_c0_g1~~TRINITY_DN55841_c0_g1_i1.p1  ORF type:complete len:155 (+),score=25.19 TRINITY_DN55841_c0_g1_i1:142-606(+)